MSNPPNKAPGSTPSPFASSGERRGSWLNLGRAVPRVIGYGLLTLFVIDIAAIFATYQPFVPSSDANLVVQLAERVGVPLVAFAFLFAADLETLAKAERLVLRIISNLILPVALIYIGLAVMSFTSGSRLSMQIGYSLAEQAKTRVESLQGLVPQLESRTEPQLRAILRGFATDTTEAQATAMDRTMLLEGIRSDIQSRIDEVRDLLEAERTKQHRLQFLRSARYALACVVTSVILFFVWERSQEFRGGRKGKKHKGMSLEREDRFVDFLRRVLRI